MRKGVKTVFINEVLISIGKYSLFLYGLSKVSNSLSFSIVRLCVFGLTCVVFIFKKQSFYVDTMYYIVF